MNEEGEYSYGYFPSCDSRFTTCGMNIGQGTRNVEWRIKHPTHHSPFTTCEMNIEQGTRNVEWRIKQPTHYSPLTIPLLTCIFKHQYVSIFVFAFVGNIQVSSLIKRYAFRLPEKVGL